MLEGAAGSQEITQGWWLRPEKRKQQERAKKAVRRASRNQKTTRDPTGRKETRKMKTPGRSAPGHLSSRRHFTREGQHPRAAGAPQGSRSTPCGRAGGAPRPRRRGRSSSRRSAPCGPPSPGPRRRHFTHPEGRAGGAAAGRGRPRRRRGAGGSSVAAGPGFCPRPVTCRPSPSRARPPVLPAAILGEEPGLRRWRLLGASPERGGQSGGTRGGSSLWQRL